MKIIWSIDAELQLQFWKKHHPKIESRIQTLINNIIQCPFNGLGKPEPLKHNLSGYWSRRIDKEHRLVYCINADIKTIEIINCKGHYK